MSRPPEVSPGLSRFSRRDFLMLKPAQPEQEISHEADQPSLLANLFSVKLSRRKFDNAVLGVGIAAITGELASGEYKIETPEVDVEIPTGLGKSTRIHIESFGPTETSKTYLPGKDVKLNAGEVEIIGHRMGYYVDYDFYNMGVEWIDLDAVVTAGVLGRVISATHGDPWISNPITGNPIITFDRASSKLGLFVNPPTFDDALDMAHEKGVKLFVELKRRHFRGEDIIHMRKRANYKEVEMVMHSKDLATVKRAQIATHDQYAVLYRPDNKMDHFETAIEEGFGLMTSFDTLMAEKERLYKYKGTIVASVKDRDQLDTLEKLGIKIMAVFGDVPVLAQGFGETITP